MEAIEGMKGSAPVKDGISIKYLKYACEKVKQRVIGAVQVMLESRAHE